MTNYEKIKNMSVEEMAEFILNQQHHVLCNDVCSYGLHKCEGYSCNEGVKQWLESEVQK